MNIVAEPDAGFAGGEAGEQGILAGMTAGTQQQNDTEKNSTAGNEFFFHIVCKLLF